MLLRRYPLGWSIALGVLAACGGNAAIDPPTSEQQADTVAAGSAALAVGSGGGTGVAGATGIGGGIASVTDGGGSAGHSEACPVPVHTPPSAECKPSRSVQATLIHGVSAYPVDAIPSGSCAETEPTCLFASTVLCPPSYAFGPSNFFSCSCVGGSWCCSALGPNGNACTP